MSVAALTYPANGFPGVSVDSNTRPARAARASVEDATHRAAEGGALDLYANILDTFENSAAQHRFEKRENQGKLRGYVRKVSKIPRVRKCGHTTRRREGVGLVVDLKAPSSKRIAGFRGLYSCASIWACPRCSAVIGIERSEEVRQAIKQWVTKGARIGRRKKTPLIGPLPFEAGYDVDSGEELSEPVRPLVWGREYTDHPPGKVVMLTLTMRHKNGDDLDFLWRSISQAWERLTRSNSTIKRNVAAYIRAAELTHGKNGWHVHLHICLFVDSDWVNRIEKHRQSIFKSWFDVLDKMELEADPKAQKLDYDPDQSATEIANKLSAYITKEASTWDLAQELTGATIKKASGENLTPRQMLAVLHAHDEGKQVGYTKAQINLLRARYAEYEMASHGKRQLTWSAGAKRAFAVAEITDQDVAEVALEDDATVRELDQGTEEIAGFKHATWVKIRNSRHLLQYVAETADEENVVTQLRDLVSGISYKASVEMMFGEEWRNYLYSVSGSPPN